MIKAMNYVEEVLETEKRARKEDYGSDMSTGEKQAIRRYLSFLLEKARKNNWAWKKLENRFGFDGDVCMGDYGEPERRYE